MELLYGNSPLLFAWPCRCQPVFAAHLQSLSKIAEIRLLSGQKL